VRLTNIPDSFFRRDTLARLRATGYVGTGTEALQQVQAWI
jgi:hypothetical protein